MIEPLNTPDWDKIVGDRWPQWHEDSYAEISHGEVETAGKTAQGVDAVQRMSSAVTSTMTGLTADAATDRFAEHTSNLTQRGEFHGRRAVVAGLLATNTANAKAAINSIATQHESQVQQLHVRAVATGMTQPDAAKEYDKIVHENRAAVDAVARQHDDTHEQLAGQFVNGEDPSVPSSMPGAGPDGGSAGVDLPPDVQDQIGQLMGSGGGMSQQLLGQGAGMAQAAAGQLGQLTSHTPGADVIQQLGSLFQGMGQGGQSTLTPEALDQLLAGQTSGGDGGDTPGELVSDDTPKDEPDPKPDPEPKPEPKPDSKPSPAAVPVSAAPPQSAVSPTTTLA